MDKKSVSELKALCKDGGMSQAGDKGTLIFRLKLKGRCDSRNLKAFDGSVPYQLNAAKLRMACAKAEVSCIGNVDEMLELLVQALEQSAPSASSSSSSSSSSSVSGKVDPVAVARRVLELDDVDDFAGILNIATRPGEPKLTSTSPTAAMRKAYLKLSLLIHPDKLGRLFDQASRAFQALVRALDRLSSAPVEDLEPQQQKGKGKTFTIARSNEGCKRTRVCCPRCQERWSERDLEGNPEYYYNFLMMGLKQYYCSTCLCEFGAMSAVHLCPFCYKSYEYSPDDYHRKISCGNKGCDKPFGFFMFTTSDQVLTELKRTVLEEHTARNKSMEAKKRRNKRSAGRESVNEESAFMLGLLDTCPRCGESLEDFSQEASQQHLRECTNTVAHAQHKAKKAALAEVAAVKEAKQDKQSSVQSAAAWKFLGAKSEQLYLLDNTQLALQAKEAGVVVEDSDMDRAELIGALASKRGHTGPESGSGSTALVLSTDGEGKKRSVRRRLDIKTLPSNLHSLSAEELRVILASHGLIHLAPRSACKKDLLELIEGEALDRKRAEDHMAQMLLKDGSAKDKDEDDEDEYTEEGEACIGSKRKKNSQKQTKKQTVGKRNKRVIVDDDDDDDSVLEVSPPPKPPRSVFDLSQGSDSTSAKSKVKRTVLQDKDKWRGSISIDGVENRLGVWNTREATVQAISSFEKGRLALVDRMGAVLEEDIRDYKFSGKDLLLLTFNQLKVGILKLFSAEQVAEHKPHLKDLARRVIGSF